MPRPSSGKARLTSAAHNGPMAWLLLLLVPIFGLPMLRMVFAPVRRGPSVPWGAIGISLALFALLWFGVGQSQTHDSTPTYAEADSALRALIE